MVHTTAKCKTGMSSAYFSAFLRTAPDHEGYPHQHPTGQFVLVKRGILTGCTEDHSWLLQPGMAGWIPPEHTHWGKGAGPIELVVLYLAPEQCVRLPKRIALLRATTLLTALCERLADTHVLLDSGRKERMIELLLDEISDAPSDGLMLTLSRDKRLNRITDALMHAPGARVTLAEWGCRVGATERTLARLFRRETGLSYKDWRYRLLLREALTGLADGLSNENLADKLGFASADCFNHWFRRQTKQTPKYFRENVSGTAR